MDIKQLETKVNAIYGYITTLKKKIENSISALTIESADNTVDVKQSGVVVDLSVKKSMLAISKVYKSQNGLIVVLSVPQENVTVNNFVVYSFESGELIPIASISASSGATFELAIDLEGYDTVGVYYEN